MKTKKMQFFAKLKNAIVNFDEYKNFSEERSSLSMKYVLKLVLIFTLIITIALTWKVINEANKLIIDFQNQFPEFSFKNDVLVLEGDNKKIVKGDEIGYFGFIVDNNQENLNDIEESGDYERVIGILKDKIVIKNADNSETITYKQLSKTYDLSNVNKNTILQFLSRK